MDTVFNVFIFLKSEITLCKVMSLFKMILRGKVLSSKNSKTNEENFCCFDDSRNINIIFVHPLRIIMARKVHRTANLDAILFGQFL